MNTRPFSCSLYRFSIDSGGRMQGQGWMVLPDSPSRRSGSQGNSLSNPDLTSFRFLNCLTVQFLQTGRARAGMLQGRSKGAQESGKHWEQTLQFNNSNSRPDSMDLITTLHSFTWAVVLWIFTSIWHHRATHMLKHLCLAQRGLSRISMGLKSSPAPLPSPESWCIDLEGVASLTHWPEAMPLLINLPREAFSNCTERCQLVP